MKMGPLIRLGALALAIVLSDAAIGNTQEIQDLLKRGKFAQALEQTEQQLAGSPKDAQLRFLKGLALTELGRRNDAVEVFQSLTADYPELPEPYNNLAVIYAQQSQFDKARAALEMAIRTHPSYATAHENLGDVYSRLASQAYSKALQLDAGNAGAQTKLALVRELISAGSRRSTASAASRASEAPPATAIAAPAVTPAAQPPVAEVAKPADPATEAVAATVREWAAAWSRKDVKAYLAFYSEHFVVPGGRSRTAWEAERRNRVGKPGNISVELEDLRVEVGESSARAHFRQRYASNNFRANGEKTLELVRDGDQWKIRREEIGG